MENETINIKMGKKPINKSNNTNQMDYFILYKSFIFINFLSIFILLTIIYKFSQLQNKNYYI